MIDWASAPIGLRGQMLGGATTGAVCGAAAVAELSALAAGFFAIPTAGAVAVGW